MLASLLARAVLYPKKTQRRLRQRLLSWLAPPGTRRNRVPDGPSPPASSYYSLRSYEHTYVYAYLNISWEYY